jgi:HlyD family secretion protein
MSLNIEEGVVLEPNAAIGLIDTIQLYLNNYSPLKLLFSKSKNVQSQTNVLEQLKTTLIEQKSSEYVYKTATKRQVDKWKAK